MTDSMGVMLRVQGSLAQAESALFEAFHDSMPLSEKWGVTTGIADVRSKLLQIQNHLNWLTTCHGTPTTAHNAEANVAPDSMSASVLKTWAGLAELDDSA